MKESKIQLQEMSDDPDMQQNINQAVKNLNTTWEKFIFGVIP